jgi:hypothetical protein
VHVFQPARDAARVASLSATIELDDDDDDDDDDGDKDVTDPALTP